jgi:Ni/Co efflux regulator RcnB
MVATRHFRAGPYRAPPGFRYRRWGLGERLPGAFFARSFWIGDFGIYGLFAPPYGYVWVRYGPDAVLIDEYTGEVISVEYGMFID